MNDEQLLEQWLKDFDAKQEALSLRQTSFLEKLGVREVTVGTFGFLIDQRFAAKCAS